MELKPESIATNPFVAAFLGAMVGLRALPGNSLGEKVWNLIGGFAFAAFLGPAFAEWAGFESVKLAAGVIFAFGAVGLVVFGSLIEGIKQTQLGPVILAWISPRNTPKE